MAGRSRPGVVARVPGVEGLDDDADLRGGPLGEVVEHCCTLAQRLAGTIARTPELELVAPVALNIVCFRVAGGDDATQEGIACWLQEAGRSVLSTTTLGGRRVLRAAIVNHRTRAPDVDGIVSDVLDARNVLMVMPRR